jgi:hypothetical protein
MHSVSGEVSGPIEHGLPGSAEQSPSTAAGRVRNPPALLSRGEHVGVPVTGEQFDAQERRDGGVD